MAKDAQYFRDYRKRVRDKCFAALGNACACCGESEEQFLEIDHIYGGGNQERAERYKNDNIFLMRADGYKNDKYQLLCANCHRAKTRLGHCIHKTERVAV